jgi:hypothetical protein
MMAQLVECLYEAAQSTQSRRTEETEPLVYSSQQNVSKEQLAALSSSQWQSVESISCQPAHQQESHPISACYMLSFILHGFIPRE